MIIDRDSLLNVYSQAGQNVTKILDDMLRGYDKRLRPEYSGPAVNVGITSENNFFKYMIINKINLSIIYN